MVKVLKVGLYGAVQDAGRNGFASIGVPISGVMDRYSFTIANSIVGNSLQEAVLEVVFGGMKLQFLEDTYICISGGDFSPKINGVAVTLNSRISIVKGAILSFGKVNYGVRCYIAVKGGFLTKKVMGSSSYYQNITESYRIKKNDILPIGSVNHFIKRTNASVKIAQSHFTNQELMCYLGPEFYLLNDTQKKKLFQQTFSISKDNNRMGYRLNETIKNTLVSILTSAVLPGTVQLTPSGKLIVLMRDSQVTGGYPRVLQLTERAINILSQKTTNDSFKFNKISI